MHNSRAIDQVNSLGQSNILPHFGLSRDWGNSAAVLFHQGVDHWRFSDVGVADQTNRNVFLIFMEDIELFQQLDQRSLSKGIRNRSLESESWGCLGQIFDPFLCDWRWDEIAFIENKDQVLVRALMLEVVLNKLSSGSVRIPSIQNIQKNIWRINNFVQFFPNSFWLPFEENSVLNFFSEIFHVTLVKVDISCRVILVMSLCSFGNKLL